MYKGPNRENFDQKFHEQRKLGWAPNTKKCNKHFHEQRKLGWLRRHPRKAKPCNTKYCENREQQQDIF
ncbi:hypothetical protein FO456_04160 [Staphylococcus lugdunensis]|nr:hypothetical protein FO456_04160 [Staphylococcus lugdunensis]